MAESEINRIAESEIKYRTPTPVFLNFPTPTSKISESDSDLCKIPDSLTWREWNLAVDINGNRGAQQEICFSKSFKRNCTISTGFPKFKSIDVKNDPLGHPGSDSDKKLRLPVLLGIRLHPKTSDSVRLQLRLGNPGKPWYGTAFDVHVHNTLGVKQSQGVEHWSTDSCYLLLAQACPCHNVRQGTNFQIPHHNPQFIFHQKAAVHVQDVVMVIITHNDHLKQNVQKCMDKGVQIVANITYPCAQCQRSLKSIS